MLRSFRLLEFDGRSFYTFDTTPDKIEWLSPQNYKYIVAFGLHRQKYNTVKLNSSMNVTEKLAVNSMEFLF